MTSVDYVRKCRWESPRLVTYSGKYESISNEKLSKGDEITSLLIDDCELIEPRVWKVGSKVFKCNKIIVENHSELNSFIELNMYYTILNKTTNYLLPTIFSIDEAKVGLKALLYETNFVNAYVNMDDNELDYSLYLLYRYDGSTNMGHLESWFKGLDIYIDTHQPDKYHTIYQLKVKDREAYNSFIGSRFSMFHDKHKRKLENFFSLKKDNFKYQVIHNSEVLRNKMELDLGTIIPKNISLNEKINLNLETYNTKEMQVIYTFAEEE
jgi:hypothetical protein